MMMPMMPMLPWKRSFLLAGICCLSCLAAGEPPATAPAPAATLAGTYPAAISDIRSFGALGDGTTVNTKAIQAAIDQANAAGGGVVLVAGGRFVTGTLYLKSDVCLRVESGATLLGSPHIADYTTDTDRTMYGGEPYMNRCLIFAKDAHNISIEGLGTIDGQGKSLPERTDPQKNRPKMLRILNCARVRMRDITLMNPASWTTEWRYSTDIAVDGITISSRTISNGDGLDFDGCTRVRVSNSAFDTGDDAICLQTSSAEKPCQDITIENCHFSSRWAGMRIGLLSRADFENVTVNNCTFRDHQDSGLKIQMGEGANMKNMIFSNLVMKNVPRPLFMTLCQQTAWVDAPRRVLPPAGTISNLQFNNILVDYDKGDKNCAFILTGLPDHPIEGISFSNIRATFPGGGTEADAKDILAELTPAVLQGWPEYGKLKGTVPALGLYARHVKGLTVNNAEFLAKAPDARPQMVFVDVSDAKISGSAEPDKR